MDNPLRQYTLIESPNGGFWDFFEHPSTPHRQITVVPKDYWDKKNLQDMGPLSVNSIHIRGLLFEKNKIF